MGILSPKKTSSPLRAGPPVENAGASAAGGSTRGPLLAPSSSKRRADGLGSALANAVLETLWPTRCAVCDRPGSLLCDACRAGLSYVDTWRACPRCGAPFGLIQCTECNPIALGRLGIEKLPFESLSCALALDDAAHRIATLFKDAGERRLARTMGELAANAVDPIWLRGADAITWVPASKKAHRRRGFDHAEDLARAFADAARASGCSAPVRGMLARPQAADQRGLTRAERAANVAGRFRAAGELRAAGTVILVDDVCTTGSTLVSAASALAQAGVATIRCVVFARTM